MLDPTAPPPKAESHAPAAAWDAFVAAHPAGHLLQTSGWAALKGDFGWQPALVCLRDGDRFRAGAQLLFKRQYGLTLGYVPRGPVVDWQQPDQISDLLAALKAECRARGASVLKLEPELPDTAAFRALLAAHGLRPGAQTIQPRSTITVDLRPGEEALLAAMKSKWRYNVRLSEKKGVSVRQCSGADLPAFHTLMAATAARDRFDVHDPAYYDAAFKHLVPRHATFLLAEFEGDPLAAIVVCAVGTRAWYLWGASGGRERNRMPNHALQWAGMRWAAARGAHFYDLWGIPDELGALAQSLNHGDGSGFPSDRLALDLDALPESGGLWGVYRFKQGFGGDIVRTVGAWDLPVNALGFAVYGLGLRALKVKKQLRDTELQRSQRTQRAAEEPTSLASPLPSQVSRLTSHLSRFTSHVSPSTWSAALAAFPAPHVLQTWEWGEIKAQTGWQAHRFTSHEGRIAFQLLTRRPVPGVPLCVGYVPKGPLVTWENPLLADAALAAVEEAARRAGCFTVKIDPDVDEESHAGLYLLERLRSRGWLFSREQVQFKNTALSDLRPSAEALLDGMKPKWRYNVRLAEKRGICVREGSEADLAAFHALYTETGARDGFLIRPLDYYLTTWRRFLRAQSTPGSPVGGTLLLAEHPEEDGPVAGLFLLRAFATTWYFYGASSERRRRDMPNYLLQWQALLWAKAQGCTRYDWWGAPTHPADEGDAMQGVWNFKQGFGAQLALHVGAWDFPVQPLLHRAWVEALPRVLAALRELQKGLERRNAQKQQEKTDQAKGV